jgi:hypothetical protein
VRANPNSLARGWVAQSDAMPPELHWLEDRITAAIAERDAWLHEHPVVRARLARIRDSAPMYDDNRPFSLFKS